MARIYIFGPSGSGTTTLATRYAEFSGVRHLDTDDYYWKNTDPPYQKSVSTGQRVSDIANSLELHENWVISGCMCSWGESILSSINVAVYLWLPWEIRQNRLRARELRRYGSDCLDLGGSRYDHFQKFEVWSEAYDTADVSMRSRQRHLAWIRDYEATGRTVLRMEQDLSVDARLDQLSRFLNLD